MSDPRSWGLGPDARLRLGRNVLVRRLRQNMTREDLASRVGVSTGRINSLEHGLVVGAGIDLWLRIADSLDDDSTIDDLLNGVRWIEPPGGVARSRGGEFIVQRRVK